jgi:hypothetical protein
MLKTKIHLKVKKTRMALSLAIKESKINYKIHQMMLWLRHPAYLDSIFLIYLQMPLIKPKTQCYFRY